MRAGANVGVSIGIGAQVRSFIFALFPLCIVSCDGMNLISNLHVIFFQAEMVSSSLGTNAN